MEELTFKNGIKIKWERGLDGGGSTQYIDFLKILFEQNKTYKKGLEWCSGMGAIGFSLLDTNLCDHMSFMDIYEPAKDWTLKNGEANHLSQKISAYCYDSVSKLPKDLKFDLVVANPPHCNENFTNPYGDPFLARLIHDENWEAHSEFFNNIKKYLMPNADLFISEIRVHGTHIEMAKNNNITFVHAYPAKMLSLNSTPNAVIMHYRNEA